MKDAILSNAMKVIGKIKPLRDITDFNTFIWNGMEFMPERCNCSSWIRENNIVRAKDFPFYKVLIRNNRYFISFPGFSQSWILKIYPFRFEPTDKDSLRDSWIFSNGIWRLEKERYPNRCFVVKGRIPFWSALLTLLGIAKIHY
jgi:hypothetical protein